MKINNAIDFDHFMNEIWWQTEKEMKETER